MLFGMAHNHQMPAIFMKVHPRTKTPWVGIVFVALLIMVPLILLRNQQGIILTLMISAAAVWLVAYVIAHIDLIVLRKKYPDYNRPFKSPWYPLPQMLGITGMVYMIINNSPSSAMRSQVYTNAGVMVIIAGVYAWLWVTFKMKRMLFDTEPIEKALSD
jgi:amino acid transporter